MRRQIQRAHVWALFALLATAMPCASLFAAADSTRGLGVYPGDPAQDFSPSLVPAGDLRRNLALHRAATQSSAYDYNLTAQLVTDGIRETAAPRWFSVTVGDKGRSPSHSRAFLLDDNVVSGVDIDRPIPITFELAGGAEPLAFDRLEVDLRQGDWISSLFPEALGLLPPRPGDCPGNPIDALDPPPVIGAKNELDGDVEWSLQVSQDGREWQEAGHVSAKVLPPLPPPPLGSGGDAFYTWNRIGSPILTTRIELDAPINDGRYRVRFEDLDCKQWKVVEVRFYKGEEQLRVGGPFHFSSAWKSAGLGEEWVAVDLGASALIDSVVPHWIHPAAEGSVQVSDDGEHWRAVAELAADGEIAIDPPAEARHVRLLQQRPTSANGYVLTELEVFGRGGVLPESRPQPQPTEEGSLHLAGGNWRLQRDSLVQGDGEAISMAGFDSEAWIAATVPGTVLASYANVGAVADLNYGANELTISDSFFHSDFWYRNEFEGPILEKGQRAFLDFDGINWKAEVFLNGHGLGRIEGAFMRGRFDLTEHLLQGATNGLAVRIERTASPGAAKQHTLAHAGQNGGAIAADNPSFHASIGWDWIPTIRGRNIGIWNDVRLSVQGPVSIDDAFLRYELPLPDTSQADAFFEIPLTNHGSESIRGVLRGSLGDVAFEQEVAIDGGTTRTVALDPSTHHQLRLENPKLWWPNGHGEPHLYDVEITFVTAEGVSDRESFRSGVRQVAYTFEDAEGEPPSAIFSENKALRLFVNGRRIVPRGGNWGFSEANLRYRGREYETAMRYHRDMNFTMVRNWVGQTGDDELYEAADRNGILIWQDFWLANPWDGPDPDDEAMFVRNARDTIRRIRNHPSVALYCGRNEGEPPPALNRALDDSVGELHPGLTYFPNSMYGSVSGGGPYGLRSREYYFTARATPKPHSELGMPSMVTLDSLQRMMPEAARWPISRDWGLHDFNMESAQKAKDFIQRVEESYGAVDTLDDWLEIAQLITYDGYRSMFEAQGKYRMGLQLWMSHSAWPSLTWQTYDYFFNPHASYYGSRKASEPLHIQWNPVTDEIEVVNYGVGDIGSLSASAEVLDLDGSVAWEKEVTIDSADDSTVEVFPMVYPEGLTPVHFIRLRLRSGEEQISENLYWRGTEIYNYRALRTLPRVAIEATTEVERQGDRYVLVTKLVNPTASPALGVRLSAIRAQSGDPVLPVLHSDNYIALMPGEEQTIETSVFTVDTRGEEPRIVVEGFNVR